MISRISLIAVFVMLTLCGCATASELRGLRFQAFDLQNDGQTEITRLEIDYGDYVFPQGGESTTLRVPKIKGIPFHQSGDATVPENAIVRWTTGGDKACITQVPIKKLIRDWSTFHGFKFAFNDRQLTLSVAEHFDAPPPYGAIKYFQAYATTCQ